MKMRHRLLGAAVTAALCALSGVAGAGERGINSHDIDSGNAASASSASERSGSVGEPYGVAVTPAVYLVNFLLLYIANPGEAANMPAYRTTIPLALSDCLDGRVPLILTDEEYQCTIGTPPRSSDQQTIFACVNNLTNSNGNSNMPLSSYGLAVTDQGDVQSLCAPQAPCLVFNQLFEGPLEKIAFQCG